MIRKKVITTGDSLGIVLPAQVCRFLDIKKGDVVEIPEIRKMNRIEGVEGIERSQRTG